MNESFTLDRPGEYHVKQAYVCEQSIRRKIKALEQQAAGHENLARGIRGEIAELRREIIHGRSSTEVRTS